MAGIYRRLLDRIERDPEAVLRGRVSLPGHEKAYVAVRGLSGLDARHVSRLTARGEPDASARPRPRATLPWPYASPTATIFMAGTRRPATTRREGQA